MHRLGQLLNVLQGRFDIPAGQVLFVSPQLLHFTQAALEFGRAVKFGSRFETFVQIFGQLEMGKIDGSQAALAFGDRGVFKFHRKEFLEAPANGFEAERFRDEGIKTARQISFLLVRQGRSRERNNLSGLAPELCQNSLGGFQAIHPRHADVHEDDVGYFAPDHFQRARAIRGCFDLTPDIGQERGEDFAIFAHIIDD